MDTGLTNKLILLGLLLVYIGSLDGAMNKRPEVFTYQGEAGVYTVHEKTGQIQTPSYDIVEYTRSSSVNHVFFTLNFPDGRSYGLNTKNPNQISSMLTVYSAGGEDLDLWFSLISGEPDFQYIDGELVNVNPSTPGLIYMQLPLLIFGILFIFIPAESLGEFCIFFYNSKRQFFSRDPFCLCTRFLGIYLFATAAFRLMAD